MIRERITSRKNPLLQHVRKLLTSRSYREKTGEYAADGVKLLAETVKWAPETLRTVLVTASVEVEVPAHVRVVELPDDVMESVSPMEAPQGALFTCALPTADGFTLPDRCLVLDGIQDPGNLGTILRTADAFGVPVALLEGCADPYSHKVVRASMGAVFRSIPMRVSWQEAEKICRDGNIPVAVTALSDHAVDIRTAPVARMAAVIGSEGQGVRKEILESAQAQLIIPMEPGCESLNAAIAAAIVMWQMKR